MEQRTTPGSQFRELLRAHLKRRTETNPSYSLRAFARQLGVSASGLSMILSGKSPVTLSFVEKTGVKLKLSTEEIHQQLAHLLNERTNINFKLKEYEFIDHDRFEMIKEWYHYAILNLMRTKDFQTKPAWIARRLGITLGEVQTAIERLQKIGILEITNGKWKDTSTKFTSHANNKQFNEAAKQNQQQLFSKALGVIEEVEFQKRNHTGSTIAIATKDLDRAKEYITKFRKQFMQEFDRPSDADEVYHIGVALFPLTKLKDQ